MSAAVSERATFAKARPFLKTVGGKTSLLPELRRLMPKEFRVYHEPFLGGGALFFDLANEGRLATGNIYLSDIVEERMIAFIEVCAFPENVISTLLEWHYEEELYYKIRASVPALLWRQAARTIYLNKSCYNGLYRVNRKGEFNVPFGRYSNPTICDSENLRACSAALTGAILQTCDFEEAFARTSKGDFLYADPPYVPTSKTSNFTAYGKDGFGESDQRRLAAAFRKHAARGVLLMLSNSNTPLVRELYEGFDIQEVQAPRAVNSKASGRGKVTELVVRSWVKP